MKRINCMGMRCPIPIIETAKVAKTLLLDERIQLSADDPATLNDLYAWGRMTNHAIEVINKTTFTITKITS